MTTAGGSGFETGDDYVAARLSIDVPDNSVQGIRQISSEVERLRTSLEAVGHIEADQTRYLEQMGEAAKRAAEAHANLSQQLQTTMSIISHYGQGPSMGVPAGGAVAPFDSSSSGMGVRPIGPQMPQMTAAMTQMHQTNPREALNMQQVRGNLPQDVNLTPSSIGQLAQKLGDREHQTAVQHNLTDTRAVDTGRSAWDFDQFQQRMQRGANLAGQVMNEVGVGGSNMGMANMAMRGLQYARRRWAQAPSRAGGAPPADGTDESGVQTLPKEGDAGAGVPSPEEAPKGGMGGMLGNLGGLAKGLLGLTGVVGSITAAFGAFEAGGKMIQGMRNVASVRGGAAGEGFKAEANAKLLAMNPFISQDQARQIYQSVMSEGYADASGSGADNVIDFMKNNLTNLNMSVADSAKLLRGTIVGEGKGDPKSVSGAVNMLSDELGQLRTASRNSVINTPDYIKQVTDNQTSMMNAGMNPEAAKDIAMGAERVGANDQVLKGQYAKAVGDMNSGGMVQGALLRQWGGGKVPAGLMPDMTAAYLGDTGQLKDADANVMKRIAQQATMGNVNTEEGKLNTESQFRRLLGAYGFGDLDAAKSATAAGSFYGEVMSGKLTDKDSDQISSAMGMGKGGGGGSSNVTGNVTIDLTPQAAKVLQVAGGSQVSLTPTQKGANAGHANSQINSDPERP